MLLAMDFKRGLINNNGWIILFTLLFIFCGLMYIEEEHGFQPFGITLTGYFHRNREGITSADLNRSDGGVLDITDTDRFHYAITHYDFLLVNFCVS
jgi:hypothetical protein